MYRRFGAEVTVVEKGPRLICREDPDISEAIRAILEDEGIAFRLDAECIRFAPHDEGVAVGVDCDSATARWSARMCCSPSAAGPTPTISASTRPASTTDERGYIIVDDDLRTSLPQHLGARRLQRPRRLHPHRLQRFRDRRRQPARRRQPPRQRPHARLCALHRSAARPRRHDRDRGAESRAQRPGRQAADDPGRPRGREAARRKGFMKIVVDADTREILGAATPRHQRRRGRARHSRHDVRQGALHGHAAHGADPPDGFGTLAHRHRGHEAGCLTRPGGVDRSRNVALRQYWSAERSPSTCGCAGGWLRQDRPL